MALEQEFICPLPSGVHARPASALEEVVRHFASEVTLRNQRTQRAANGKSKSQGAAKTATGAGD